MPEQDITVEELGKRWKQKYPEYSWANDIDLGNRVKKKFPEYSWVKDMPAQAAASPTPQQKPQTAAPPQAPQAKTQTSSQSFLNSAKDALKGAASNVGDTLKQTAQQMNVEGLLKQVDDLTSGDRERVKQFPPIANAIKASEAMQAGRYGEGIEYSVAASVPGADMVIDTINKLKSKDYKGAAANLLQLGLTVGAGIEASGRAPESNVLEAEEADASKPQTRTSPPPVMKGKKPVSSRAVKTSAPPEATAPKQIEAAPKQLEAPKTSKPPAVKQIAAEEEIQPVQQQQEETVQPKTEQVAAKAEDNQPKPSEDSDKEVAKSEEASKVAETAAPEQENAAPSEDVEWVETADGTTYPVKKSSAGQTETPKVAAQQSQTPTQQSEPKPLQTTQPVKTTPPPIAPKPNTQTVSSPYQIGPVMDVESIKQQPLPTGWQKIYPPTTNKSYGGIIVSPDGKFLLREPTNHYEGYHWTWPKGQPDNGEHPVETAMREVQEETGHKGKIFGVINDPFVSKSGKSVQHFYLMQPDEQPTNHGWETQQLKWATYEEAKDLINQSTNQSGKERDLQILEAAHKQLSAPVKAAAQSTTGPIKTSSPPVAKPKAPTVAQLKKTHAEADQKFNAIKQAGFSDPKPANVAGIHSGKQFYTDSEGNQWLFKPKSSGWPSFVPYAEEAAYKIGRLVKQNPVEVRHIELGGKTGTIQKMLMDAKPITSDLSKLTKPQLETLQAEQLVDWLTSNHDAHPAQWLINKDGDLIGIDKGQSFKYFPNDQLDPSYHPSGGGVYDPIYKHLHDQVKSGKVKLNVPALKKAITKIESIPDKDLIAAVKDYAEARWADKAKQQNFYEDLVARKNGIRDAMQKYWSDVPSINLAKVKKLPTVTGSGPKFTPSVSSNELVKAPLVLTDKPASLSHSYSLQQQHTQEIANAIKNDPAVIKYAQSKHGTTQIQDVIDGLVSSWAGSSKGTKTSLAMQLAAHELFGGSMDILKNIYDFTHGKALFDQHGEALKVILKAQYDATQEYFKKHGIKNLLLYRGQNVDPVHVKDGEATVGVVKIQKAINSVMQPLSSFTTDANIAFKRKYLIVADVPVEKIHSFSGTGLGTQGEKEVVVAGNLDGTSWIISGHDPYSVSKQWVQKKLNEVAAQFK